MKPNENHIGEKRQNRFRGKAAKCLRRNSEENEREHPGSEKAEHLNKAIRFDLSFYLSETHKKTAQIEFKRLSTQGKKQDNKFKAFEILLANLFRKPKTPIRISLNKNDWKKTIYNKYPISYQSIRDSIDILVYNKFIIMDIGLHKIPNKLNKQTRIEATEELLKLFPQYEAGVLSKPIELVILKGEKEVVKDKNGKPVKDKNGNRKVLKRKQIDYKDSEQTQKVRQFIWGIRDILTTVNDVNSKADIRYEEFKLNANLVAVFIEKFTWGGRLQTRGFSHYQGLSGKETEEKENERDKITINGDSTVELDYGSLHPNLLYAAEGIQYKKDPYRVVDEREELRPLLKAILLRMINGKSAYHVRSSVINFLQDKKNKKFYDLVFDMDIDIADLIDKFMEVHEPIAHYLCSGKETGMELMNKDAKIARDIVNHFGKKGIPILCIHDSFRVQKQHRDELFMVMKKTYQKHNKGFEITVK